MPPQWPITFDLQKPFGRIKQLTLREPLAHDIIEVGNPISIEIKQRGSQYKCKIRTDKNKMLRMIRRLSDTSVKKLDKRDYKTIVYHLRQYFVPDFSALIHEMKNAGQAHT